MTHKEYVKRKEALYMNGHLHSYDEVDAEIDQLVLDVIGESSFMVVEDMLDENSDPATIIEEFKEVKTEHRVKETQRQLVMGKDNVNYKEEDK